MKLSRFLMEQSMVMERYPALIDTVLMLHRCLSDNKWADIMEEYLPDMMELKGESDPASMNKKLISSENALGIRRKEIGRALIPTLSTTGEEMLKNVSRFMVGMALPILFPHISGGLVPEEFSSIAKEIEEDIGPMEAAMVGVVLNTKFPKEVCHANIESMLGKPGEELMERGNALMKNLFIQEKSIKGEDGPREFLRLMVERGFTALDLYASIYSLWLPTLEKMAGALVSSNSSMISLLKALTDVVGDAVVDSEDNESSVDMEINDLDDADFPKVIH